MVDGPTLVVDVMTADPEVTALIDVVGEGITVVLNG